MTLTIGVDCIDAGQDGEKADRDGTTIVNIQVSLLINYPWESRLKFDVYNVTITVPNVYEMIDSQPDIRNKQSNHPIVGSLFTYPYAINKLVE